MTRLANPSPQQQTIFNWQSSGRGSVVVIAVAGASKTTTIVEMANRIPVGQSAAFVAFNKSIAEELKARLPKHVRAMTLNGMGFSTWMRHQGNPTARVEVDGKKTMNIMQRIFSPETNEQYMSVIPKLVSLAKGAGIVPDSAKYISITRDTDEAWVELMEHYDVDTDNQLEAIDLARQVLREAITTGKEVVDFDDQLYLPVICGARFWQNDWLFVDEAQDVNKIQRAMLKRALRPTGRLVAVGDPAQAIYGFRGADCNSITNIKREFGAGELPLTVSYRCPRAVVAKAQEYVSHIEAHPSAPEGSVQRLEKYIPTQFQPTDAILCRNTGPLVDLCFRLIRNKVACRVLGREIGAGLVALIKKMKAKTLDGLLEKIAAHWEREQAKFIAKGQEDKAASLRDRLDTIQVFIDNLDENSRTIPQLITAIESLFTDNGKGTLTLCTVHKAKGLEFPTVYILDPELMPSKWARQAWQQEQESNLQYVAVTRAKEELVYISSKGLAA